MRNKADLDDLSMDDLYKNLKVYEAEIKGQSSSSSNSQNVAFVSSENTSSTNEAVNTAHEVSTASLQGQASSLTYADNVMFSFFVNQSNSPQLDNKDLEQIDTDDLEEIDLKWQVAMLVQTKPKKVIQALVDPRWVEAMQEELLQFRLQKVWTLVDLPNGKRPLEPNGYLETRKIREESLLEIRQDWWHKMDVKSAFLYGTIKEDMYVCQPPSFEDPQFSDKVYKVEKALYGLHQALRFWYETLSTYLLENGFRRGTIDKTLFIKKYKGDIMLVQVYVDGIIFGHKRIIMCEFEQMMHKRFQMSSIGELTFFLGLQVKQKDDGIFISQDKYVADILKKFDFATVKTASTPIETNKALLKDEEAKDVDVHLYRSMIGSLMYLTTSRPDIMFAVCACARFQVTPKVSHLHAVKRIFRYLKASLDRKFTTGSCQFLSKRLISWKCKKQTIVDNSTTEAEYVAVANCYGQVSWIQNQMLDYGFNFINTKIYINNESTIYTLEPQPQTSTAPLTLEEQVPDVATYHPQKTQTPRQAKRGHDTKIPQSGGPPKKVGDEAVHKELGDRVERSATTAASLDAEQYSGGNTPGSDEERIEQDDLTDFVPPTPYDSPLSGGYTPGSDEGRPNINELMAICINLSNRVLALETSKTAQDLIGTSKRKSLDKEYVSKQGRKSDKTKPMFDDSDFVELDVDNAIENVKVLLILLQVLLEIFFEDEMMTITDTLMAIRSTRPRTTTVVIRDVEEEPSRATLIPIVQSQDKDIQARMDTDELLAERLQQEEREQFTIEEKYRMLVEMIAKRKRFFAAQRAEQIRNKPPTRAQLRNQECRKKIVARKRTGEKLNDESVKRQKIEDDAEKEALRAYLDIISGDDEAVNVESLATKYPIVDWKTHALSEDKMYYEIIRGDGSTKSYKIFTEMLDDFDRQDVLDLYRLVKERFETASLEGYDRLLWGDLITVFEPSEDDDIWKAQQDYTLIS
ncbi:putative ribonuclease H-like domain-containing protein [Tanacetum coccineum]